MGNEKKTARRCKLMKTHFREALRTRKKINFALEIDVEHDFCGCQVVLRSNLISRREQPGTCRLMGQQDGFLCRYQAHSDTINRVRADVIYIQSESKAMHLWAFNFLFGRSFSLDKILIDFLCSRPAFALSGRGRNLTSLIDSSHKSCRAR